MKWSTTWSTFQSGSLTETTEIISAFVPRPQAVAQERTDHSTRSFECIHEMVHDAEHSSIRKPERDHRDHLGSLFQEHKQLPKSESIIQLDVPWTVFMKQPTTSSTPPSGSPTRTTEIIPATCFKTTSNCLIANLSFNSK